MNNILTLFFIFFCFLPELTAQGKIRVKPANGINTASDDVVCGFIGNDLIVATNDRQDMVNDFKWNEHKIFRLKRFKRGADYCTYTSIGEIFAFNSSGDEGTACYDKADSILYFSSTENYGKGSGTNLKLYSAQWNGSSWKEPELLSFCTKGYDYTHPVFDQITGQMVFSSNKPGGRGGMDIWYTYRSGKNWTEPENLGILVNTAGHEIFPTLFHGDIYFSSNGLVDGVGFDLFRAVGRDQWKISIQLPEPYNSAANDLRIFFVNKDKGFITSDRKGSQGGDDIFVFEDEGEKQIMGKGYYAMLLCKGEAVPRATCVIKNELGETVLNGVLDEAGKISLDELSLNRKYKLSVTGIDPASYNTSVLRIMDYQGNMIHELYLNSMGWVELELLMFNYTDLPLRTNIDKSILTIDVSGQVYNETPGDVGADKLITIIDEKGETVAVAYTNETGSFRFTNLFPELDYRFHLTEKSNALNIIVLDRGKSIVLPVLEEEAHYIRLKGEEAIQLVNEFNETVYISPEDIFVINRIYYSYNSAELSERAKTQLDRLTDVLNSNPLLHVELRAHTDSRGSSETNLLLSKQRADNTAEYLILHGISAIRITTMGIGESEPVNHCKDGIPCSEEEYGINRRTDIRLFNQ